MEGKGIVWDGAVVVGVVDLEEAVGKAVGTTAVAIAAATTAAVVIAAGATTASAEERTCQYGHRAATERKDPQSMMGDDVATFSAGAGSSTTMSMD